MKSLPMTLVLLLACAGMARAHQPVSLGLAECVRLGLEQNDDLQNARYDAVLAGERVIATTGIYDTRLHISGVYEDSELPSSRSLGAGSSGGTVAAGIAKPLASGTILGLASSANQFEFLGASAQPGGDEQFNSFSVAVTLEQSLLKNAWGKRDRMLVDAETYGFEAATYDYFRAREATAAQIYNMYWNAYASAKFYEVTQQAVERARHLLEVNRGKLADGLLDETDILAAEAQLATREVDVLTQRDAKLAREDDLRNLLAIPRDQWDVTTFRFELQSATNLPAHISFLDAYETALKNRWDLRSLRKKRSQIEKNIEVQKQDARPDLRVFGSYGKGDSGGSFSESVGYDQTIWSVGAEFEMPWSRTTEKSAVRRAGIQLVQIDNSMASLVRYVDLRCRTAARDLLTAAERVRAAKHALDLHDRKLELEEDKLEQGRSTTQLVIDYQDDVAFADWDYISAVSVYQKALAQYRLVQGTLLEDDPLLETELEMLDD